MSYFVLSATLLVAFVTVAGAGSEERPEPPTQLQNTGFESAVSTLTITRQQLCSGTISPFQYGQFIEDLCGLTLSMSAEQVHDARFEGVPPYGFVFRKETDRIEKPWHPDEAVHRGEYALDADQPFNGRVAQRIRSSISTALPRRRRAGGARKTDTPSPIASSTGRSATNWVTRSTSRGWPRNALDAGERPRPCPLPQLPAREPQRYRAEELMIRATTVAMFALIGVPAGLVSSGAADELAATGKRVEDGDALLNLRLKLRQTGSIDVNGVRIDLSSAPDGPDLHFFLGQLGAQLLHLTFRESDLARLPTKAELQKWAAQDRIAKEITVGGQSISPAAPPRGLKLCEELGLMTAEAVRGQIVHRAAPGKDVYETRAVITPGGDFLLMFPEGKHYGSSKGEKVNEMIACRSSDKGETWTGPEVAFDIDYSQHGFVPLIPRGSRRIYAFGTQPIPGKWSPERGLHENAPIGFRWSDDDGHTWSDAKLIEPVNDPGFLGMSVMRMTETESGAWLIGSHEGDWSKKPLQTRQYILRSEDRGQTWTVLPRPRPDGWCVKGFGRMDEGRPVGLGGGKVLAMFRTPEGHLWSARSEDDGKTWTDPAPTPLVHPDAPPMLFLLADGKTLVAFHHNRHARSQYVGLTANMEGQRDRSELWVSTSTDEGRTWSEPRFVLANALAPKKNIAWYDYQCSYGDLIVDGENLHLFLPHRWEHVLHLRLKASDIPNLPTRSGLCRHVVLSSWTGATANLPATPSAQTRQP